MEKLKIVINGNEDIAKEASGLFEELGYYVSSENKNNFYGWSLGENQGDYYVNQLYFNIDAARLVTIEELRALVSLHKNPINIDKVLNEVRSDALGLIGGAKEYLVKTANGYSYTMASKSWSDNWIEIPEGAETAILGSENNIYFWKSHLFTGGIHKNWINMESGYDANWYLNKCDGSRLLWQRHTHPEELPFVDDEPSLNDQYSEIEKVRQEYKLRNDMTVDDYFDTLRSDESSKHNHYFIDVSDVDEVDFYEIALRYNVTDPCIQHILKKCLAVGNRGHKDFHTDLKDIYDTAARALRIHGG